MTRNSDDDRVRRALEAVREMRSRIERFEARARAPIAVIGMACRLPGGVESPEALWELVERGEDAVTLVPPNRWRAADWYDADVDTPGRMNTRWGGFLADVEHFDPEFFGITRREARTMDPQQRLLLEVTHEVLERSGLRLDRLAGSAAGVFVGAQSFSGDYAALQFARPDTIDLHTATGTSLSILANRISYWLDLRGPSLTVDTACSSSLVAVHLAVQSLRSGESDVALAGGVNLVLSPTPTLAFSKMHLFSADGRCKTFDAAADGIVRAEGVVVIALKRLVDAQADGDRVLAVLAGSAVNQDGRTNGLTAPSGLSQQVLVRKALADAGLSPQEVTFVETHGTGTPLGDPIEVGALAEVLGVGDDPCWLGALKTNIGHAEGAAGAAGLMKAILALQRRTIPPNLHLRRPNPHLSLNGTRFRLPAAPTPWTASGVRAAGVSSFGFGGTSAHVIVTEAPETPDGTAAGEVHGLHLLVVSGARSTALRTLARSYAELLERGTAARALCAAAVLRRTLRAHRLAVVADSGPALARSVRRWLAGENPDEVVTGVPSILDRRRVVFLYPGIGSDGLGRALELATDPSFAAAFERCDETFIDLAGWSLTEALRGGATMDMATEPHRLPPFLFAVQVGFTEVWRRWGFRPGAVLGHGVGEVTAAWATGDLSLAEALRLVYDGAVSGRPVPPLRANVDAPAPIGGEDWDAIVIGPGDEGADSMPGPLAPDTSLVASLGGDGPAEAQMLRALGELVVRGHGLDPAGLHPTPPPPVDLPTHPWERERLWLDGVPIASAASRAPVSDSAAGLPRESTQESAATERAGWPARAIQDLESWEVATEVGRIVRREVAGVLGASPPQLPSPRTGFSDLGLDSLMAVELARRLSTVVGKDLPTTLVLEYPNVATLSEHLLVVLGVTDAEDPAPGVGRDAESELHGESGPDEDLGLQVGDDDSESDPESDPEILRELEELGY